MPYDRTRPTTAPTPTFTPGRTIEPSRRKAPHPDNHPAAEYHVGTQEGVILDHRVVFYAASPMDDGESRRA